MVAGRFVHGREGDDERLSELLFSAELLCSLHAVHLLYIAYCMLFVRSFVA